MAAFGLGTAVSAHASFELTSTAASAPAGGSQTSAICAVPTVTGVAYQAPKPLSGPAPAPTNIAPNAASAGTIVVTGSDFVGACARTVQIGSAMFSSPTLGVDMTGQQTMSIKLTATKPLPPGASGAVFAILSDWQGGANSSDTGTVRIYNLIQTPAAQTKDASLVAGATQHVSGNGFTPFASAPSGGGLPGARAVGTYPACAGSPQFLASVVGDGALTLGTPATACNGPLDLTFIAAAYSDPAPAANQPGCGASPSFNCITVTVTAGSVQVLPNGSGQSTGGGTVGPGGSNGGGTARPGGSSGGRGNIRPGGPPATTTPIVNPSPNASNQLRLSVASVQSTPGSTVDFTATFVVNGQPAAAAPITITLLSAPSFDATVTPKQGDTDSHGRLQGKLHLSASAGDHLLLARSGIYSDEIHVLGAPPAVKSGADNPTLGLDQLHITVSGNPLVIWLSVACAALVLLGVLVNIEVIVGAVWGLTFARLIFLLRSNRRGRRVF